MPFLLFILCALNSCLMASMTATTENEPNSFVNHVNVITGDLYLVETDGVIAGGEPLVLQRNYVSLKGFGYWNMFPYQRAFADFQDCILEVLQPSGARLFYRWDTKWKKKGPKRTFYLPAPDAEQLKGIANTARGKISGKTNLKNQHVQMESDGDKFSVVCPDGTKRFYEIESRFAVEEFMDWNVSSLRGSASYLLTREELPNGRQILYQWPKKKTDVWKISTSSPSGDTTFAWAKFYPHNGKHGKSRGDYGIETSDGRTFEFSFFSHQKVHQLKKVISNENPPSRYRYISWKDRKFLSSISHPEGMSLKIEYYLPGEHFGKRIDENDPVCFRVKELIVPVGESGEEVITHRFFYDILGRKATVLDRYDVPTEYFWDEELRLVKIKRFKDPKALYNMETFVWGAKGSSDETNLLCQTLFDGTESPLQSTRYLYDSYGNILRKTFYGNLSGEGSSPLLNLEGFPIEGSSESYTKEYVYSENGQNLLEEKEENGLSISYTYFQNTPLLEKETTFSHGILAWQKSYRYDHDHNLIEEHVQDLQGNFNKKTVITERSNDRQSKSLPTTFLEIYGGSKKTKTRTKIAYGIGGRIASKEVLGSRNKLLSSSHCSYERGCLVSETNLAGQKATYRYNERNLLISYQDFGAQSEKRIEYDNAGRPVAWSESGERIFKISKASYDCRGDKVASYDSYGNKTSYTYDPFHHVVRSVLPEGGEIVYGYDAQGNLSFFKDPKGYVTQTTYNAYNQIVSITHPNGHVEKFVYYPNGSLKSYVNLDGLESTYTYDVFGRELSKQTPYTLETKSYDSFHLLSETDAEGHEKRYEYDSAGRKTAEAMGEDRLEYFYDDLGRTVKITSGNLSLLREYTSIGHVSKEQKISSDQQLLEEVLYQYNPAGSLIAVQKEIDGKMSEERFEYDSIERISAKVDAQGHRTTFHYDDSGHRRTTIDPLGRQILETFAYDERPKHLETYAPEGTLLFQESYSYDANRNLVRKQWTSFDRSLVTLWEYDEMNRPVLLIEGSLSPDERKTAYSYTPGGKLKTTTRPGGTQIMNTYTLLGGLASQVSSDDSIHYTYTCDRVGRLLQSVDEKTGKTLTRSYTPQGNLLQETLPSGLSFQNEYDAKERRTSFTLPDLSQILYEYDALYLRKLSRIKKGHLAYAHEYTRYDRSGNLLEERSATGDFSILRHYDSACRLIEISSPRFSEKALSFDAVGNLLAKSRNKELFSYTYDPLNQLTSEKGFSYKYDMHYNRLEKNGKASLINALDEILDLTYDIDGNPTSWEGKVLSYDAFDRLISVESPQEKIVYSYDSLHRRISKERYKAGSLVEHLNYLYDGSNEIGVISALSGKCTELRVLGNVLHAEAGAAVALELHGQVYLPLHDLQGSTCSVLAADGSQEQCSYSAFGEEEVGAFFSPWRFSSKRIDPETGFAYFGRRYYLPQLGRWLTQDPIGRSGGVNLYAFVRNSPLVLIDSYGLFAEGPAYDFPPIHLDCESKEFRSNTFYTVGSKEVPDRYIIFENGINTNLSEAKEYAKRISDYGGGIKVFGVHNPSGFLSAYIGLSGRERGPSKALARQCEEFFNRYPKGPQRALLVGHSDGGTHIYEYLRRLDEKTRDRFLVLGIAPASVVPPEFCFQPLNYSSFKDIVPMARAILEWMAEVDDEYSSNYLPLGLRLRKLTFLKPRPGSHLFDHNFDSPTFSNELKKHIDNYVNTGDL